MRLLSDRFVLFQRSGKHEARFGINGLRAPRRSALKSRQISGISGRRDRRIGAGYDRRQSLGTPYRRTGIELGRAG